MRKRWRWSPEHNKLMPIETEGPRRGLYVIPDIQPYKAICGDMTGKYITSRSQHREFVKRNNLIEVGNEYREFTRYGGKSRDNPFARPRDE